MGYEEIKDKIDLTERQYNIYKLYLSNFKEKQTNPTKCFLYKRFLNAYLYRFTFFIINRTANRYCPYCCNPVNKLTYDDSPIFVYGCNTCRIKTKD